tara:strand:- start:90 stop:578 length:489 start_codon:yes stop_codon:yes gene_type:complete
MKKFIFIFAQLLLSIASSQDKMILKSGEEIILKDRTNFYEYDDKDYFIYYDSKYFTKKNIAQLKLDNGDIIFKSGMPISKYEPLSIEKKAKADKRTSSKNFKNINYALLGNLNEEETQIYLKSYGSTVSSPGKSFGIFAGACSVVMIAIIFSSPYFMSAGLG